jgi:hypothetical protein
MRSACHCIRTVESSSEAVGASVAFASAMVFEKLQQTKLPILASMCQMTTTTHLKQRDPHTFKQITMSRQSIHGPKNSVDVFIDSDSTNVGGCESFNESQKVGAYCNRVFDCAKKFFSASVLLLLCAFLFHCNGQLTHRVMPWMCLQRCNETIDDIQQNLQQLQQLAPCLSAVSFELYNLGPNGTLVTNSELYQVGPDIRLLGLESFVILCFHLMDVLCLVFRHNRYPMISSFPYPPEFLDWMRQLWTDSTIGDAFITQLQQAAQDNEWTGFQVDWEPTGKY